MARATQIIYSFVDDKGKTSSTRVSVPTNLTIADWTTFAIEMGNNLTSLSTGVLTKISICVPVDITVGTTLKAVANAAADVANKVLMIFRTAVAGFKARFNIPTYDEQYSIAGTDKLDSAAINPAAIISIMEAGYTTATPADVNFTDSRGNAYGTFDKGLEKFRNL